MNAKARAQLIEIVRDEPSTLMDERLCRALLRDGCAGECDPEINLLMTAFEAGIPERLRRSSTLEPGVLVVREAQWLTAERHLQAEASQWAVASWAVALGLQVPAEVADERQPPPPPPNPKPKIFQQAQQQARAPRVKPERVPRAKVARPPREPRPPRQPRPAGAGGDGLARLMAGSRGMTGNRQFGWAVILCCALLLIVLDVHDKFSTFTRGKLDIVAAIALAAIAGLAAYTDRDPRRRLLLALIALPLAASTAWGLDNVGVYTHGSWHGAPVSGSVKFAGFVAVVEAIAAAALAFTANRELAPSPPSGGQPPTERLALLAALAVSALGPVLELYDGNAFGHFAVRGVNYPSGMITFGVAIAAAAVTLLGIQSTPRAWWVLSLGATALLFPLTWLIIITSDIQGASVGVGVYVTLVGAAVWVALAVRALQQVRQVVVPQPPTAAAQVTQ